MLEGENLRISFCLLTGESFGDYRGRESHRKWRKMSVGGLMAMFKQSNLFLMKQHMRTHACVCLLYIYCSDQLHYQLRWLHCLPTGLKIGQKRSQKQAGKYLVALMLPSRTFPGKKDLSSKGSSNFPVWCADGTGMHAVFESGSDGVKCELQYGAPFCQESLMLTSAWLKSHSAWHSVTHLVS